MKRVNVAVTLGDPAGVGPQVIVRALKSLSGKINAVFFVIGDSHVFNRYGLKQDRNTVLIDLKNISSRVFSPGRPNKDTARASLEYLDQACCLIKKGQADCLVTGPISKKNITQAGFRWPGHTEFLADSFGVKDVEMVFVSGHFRVVLLTRHMSIKEALRSISARRLEKCSAIVFELLKKGFKISKPKIAVAGLNPHAGEEGLFGREEITILAPAIKKLNRLYGKHFFGPYPADTVFHKACQGAFDLVVAMYHDQGLIPFKMVAFESGVNLTAGLPFIRTSPVHGTAFDIASKHNADHRSMKSALELAYRLSKS